MAVHKLERQLRRKKSRERDNKHSGTQPSSYPDATQ
jgi:ribosome-associated translation inhibitor RaiA